MGKSTRQVKRKLDKKKKKDAEAALSSKLNMFDKMGDSCLICFKTFDKKNKEMIQSWHVVVNNQQVKLYCPECWTRAEQLVEKIKKDE